MNLKIITTNAAGKTTAQECSFRPDAEGIENQVVNLYPEISLQTLEGFGGAITDAAGFIYSLMNDSQK